MFHVKHYKVNMCKNKHLQICYRFDIIYSCNKYSVTWSGSEDSSHIISYLCALFLWGEIMNYIEICMEEAKKSLLTEDVPIGALIVLNDEVIAYGHNTREACHSVLGHAEINAIEEATRKLQRWNLSDCEMYVTLEPCSMCKEVIKQTRIKKVYYLLSKPLEKKEYNKTEIQKSEDRKYEQMYANILSDFFKKRR